MKLTSRQGGELSPRQRDVLNVIQRHDDESGRFPTYAAIGKALGVSRVTAFEHVHYLKCKGYLDNSGKMSRSAPHRRYGPRISTRRDSERVITGIRKAIEALNSFQVAKAERILKSLLP